MSREVLPGEPGPNRGPDPADGPESNQRPGPTEQAERAERAKVPRRTFAARTVTRFTLLALVAAAATVALVGRLVGGDADRGLQARLEADPSAARPELTADLDRLGLVLVLTNPGRTEQAVDQIRVTGLGPVLDDLAPSTLRIPGGGSARIPITVTPDCALLDRAAPAVLVPGVTVGAPTGEPRALLAPLCPPAVAGLAVDVVAARPSGVAGIDVRLVNHGSRTAVVVAPEAPDARTRLRGRPELPLTLVPGQAVTVSLAVATTNCPEAGGASAGGPDVPALEARTPEGYAPVGNWPVDLARIAASRCGDPRLQAPKSSPWEQHTS